MIEQVDLLSKIENSMPEFSKGQKKIGRYILENYDKAAFMTASKLGVTVNVSESTVVRFAMNLGFEGYPEMQSCLREYIRTKLTSVQRIELTQDRLGSDILNSVLTSDIEKIKATLECISKIDFENAVNAMINARTIYILGVRSSGGVAYLMDFYFRFIFRDVRFIQTTSRSEMFERLFQIGQEDTVFAISFPRYSKRIISGVEYAKRNGAHIISLTDNENSPLGKLADDILIARTEMVSFVDSLVAPISVVNALVAAVVNKKHSEVEKTFGKLEKLWDEYDVYDKEINNE